MNSFEVGDMIEISEDLAVDHTVLRWGKPDGTEAFIQKGKYIVDHVAPDEVRFSDADWDENGKVTFHSTKHGYIVRDPSTIAYLEKSILN